MKSKVSREVIQMWKAYIKNSKAVIKGSDNAVRKFLQKEEKRIINEYGEAEAERRQDGRRVGRNCLMQSLDFELKYIRKQLKQKEESV